jgi:hypothetical protein
MKKNRRRKCRHCRELFRPDPRNHRHQRYCSKPACRRASKAASQRHCHPALRRHLCTLPDLGNTFPIDKSVPV